MYGHLMEPQSQNGNYHGVSSPIREISGLRLAERTYAPDFKTPRHSHREAYFCLILDGSSRQTYGSKIRIREPLTTAFYPPNELQSESFGRTGSRIFNVEIDSHWLRHFHEYSVIGEQSNDYRGGSVAWLMMKLYHEFRRMDHTSALMIEGLTLEIIAEASRQFAPSQNRTPRWLEHARDILHEQFADSITLSSLADLVGVHPVYLASSFRKKYQCTIGEYRQRLRIEFACRELTKAHSSLAQIALAAGFANQAHFSKTFKRFTGTTPARYRTSSLGS
jgi:AraC family transcriptional regulator